MNEDEQVASLASIPYGPPPQSLEVPLLVAALLAPRPPLRHLPLRSASSSRPFSFCPGMGASVAATEPGTAAESFSECDRLPRHHPRYHSRIYCRRGLFHGLFHMTSIGHRFLLLVFSTMNVSTLPLTSSHQRTALLAASFQSTGLGVAEDIPSDRARRRL